MKSNDIIAFAKKMISGYTPLENDCGKLCGKRCCKGDKNTGMELFPNEKSEFSVLSGERKITVCGGSCNRSNRPLSCMIFPFIPYIHKDGHISAEIDGRAIGICPLADNADVVKFNKDFLIKVRKIGRILYKDKDCRKMLIRISEDSDQYKKLLGYDKTFSKRR